ncbi:hypothetical protein [Vibrio fluvialis]|uniref:hypothetical protein n=1 Tax=Vibrio fluvialis TaxID=676 RepID=UPI002ACA5301|nr:hypothetical protein [Vibrio fluvialis]MDZ5517131.1 hypothetical protein [Vibrio fluvialis]
MEYHSNSFPFVAGQRTDKLFGSSHVLSPLPIKTQLPKAGRCDQLVAKTAQYLDIGGAGGMIFQTQLMWMMFLMGATFFYGPILCLEDFLVSMNCL